MSKKTHAQRLEARRQRQRAKDHQVEEMMHQAEALARVTDEIRTMDPAQRLERATRLGYLEKGIPDEEAPLEQWHDVCASRNMPVVMLQHTVNDQCLIVIVLTNDPPAKEAKLFQQELHEIAHRLGTRHALVRWPERVTFHIGPLSPSEYEAWLPALTASDNIAE